MSSFDQTDQLNVPLTTDEFLMAVKYLKSHKAPGPDGFTGAYYKGPPHSSSQVRFSLQFDP